MTFIFTYNILVVFNRKKSLSLNWTRAILEIIKLYSVKFPDPQHRWRKPSISVFVMFHISNFFCNKDNFFKNLAKEQAEIRLFCLVFGYYPEIRVYLILEHRGHGDPHPRHRHLRLRDVRSRDGCPGAHYQRGRRLPGEKWLGSLWNLVLSTLSSTSSCHSLNVTLKF